MNRLVDGALERGSLQRPGELGALLQLLQEREPGVILEVGTHTGGTTWAIRCMFPDAIIVTVDLVNRELRLNGELRLGVRHVTGSSQDPATFERVVHELDGASVDALLVDGGHRFEEVAADVILYGQLLHSAGLLCLHDVRARNPHLHCEVWRYWQDVCSGLPGAVVLEEPVDAYGWGIVPAGSLRGLLSTCV